MLAFLLSAFAMGAAPASYVRARRLLVQRGTVTGIEATDQRTGRDFQIRAEVVVNAGGPWAAELVDECPVRRDGVPPPLGSGCQPGY